MNLHRLVILPVAACLAACASGPVATVGPDLGVTVMGRVALQAGVTRAYQLLAVPGVEAPKREDVASVRVHLTRTDAGTADHSEKDLGLLPNGVDGTVELRNLKLDASYVVRLSALDGEGAAIDDNATSGASPSLGLSETEVATTNVETQNGLSFRLKLKDVVFSGQGNGSVSVTDGQVLDSPEAEALATPAL